MSALLDRICIVMMSAVGDAVHVCPVITAIKRAHPSAHITWVLQPGPATLVRGHPAVDDIVLFDRSAGARGFLLKGTSPESLVQAIEAAARGDAMIAPNVTARLLARFAELEPGSPPAQPIEPLTEREEEVLRTVARGRTNEEIARELFISLSTVKTHVASLMGKLGARNRVELAIFAYATKRVTPG